MWFTGTHVKIRGYCIRVTHELCATKRRRTSSASSPSYTAARGQATAPELLRDERHQGGGQLVQPGVCAVDGSALVPEANKHMLPSKNRRHSSIPLASRGMRAGILTELPLVWDSFGHSSSSRCTCRERWRGDRGGVRDLLCDCTGCGGAIGEHLQGHGPRDRFELNPRCCSREVPSPVRGIAG